MLCAMNPTHSVKIPQMCPFYGSCEGLCVWNHKLPDPAGFVKWHIVLSKHPVKLKGVLKYLMIFSIFSSCWIYFFMEILVKLQISSKKKWRKSCMTKIPQNILFSKRLFWVKIVKVFSDAFSVWLSSSVSFRFKVSFHFRYKKKNHTSDVKADASVHANLLIL